MKQLMNFKKNEYSQNGEDGILEEIFKTIGIDHGVFCEFGAWDGIHCSNTYRFYKYGWMGWYIEGDQARYQDLVNNAPDERVEKVLAWVSLNEASSLDKILKSTNLYKKNGDRLDLLSIDIDSDDLAVWKSLKEFRPTVVVIEYNWTIPFDTCFENPQGENKGNSALSIFKFAEKNGYDLIAITSCNLIFIESAKNNKQFEVVNLNNSEMDNAARYFFGFDGSLIIGKAGKAGDYKVQEVMIVPWNTGVFSQPVIKPLRAFGSKWHNKVSFLISVFSVALRRPISSFKRFIKVFIYD
jgi:hypothetical protein